MLFMNMLRNSMKLETNFEKGGSRICKKVCCH
ncbi:hypothetical protein CLORY_38850 [Clostridium oryzae]|uniref:Uncharacterized protein n=1 Tax=Clostridium oryzae TaxID=1450648 RepID=A0A1V4ID70_9CLOT|nr:hypothetical protein CLORY_38850 [Clostridium oryzae]